MEKQNQYVDLLTNGRLFPTWVMENFKQYELPEIFQDNKDACDRRSSVVELRSYQKFVSAFLDYRSIYKDILVYHGLGSGKTNTVIQIYNILYNYNPAWNVFILLKASLQNNWEDELNDWLQKDEKEYRMKNIIFIHYDSPIADKTFLEAVRISDSSKNNMYIIEEAHNFISNVYSNVSTSKGKRAQVIYDYILQDKKENDKTRVVMLSGSPVIHKPFELALLFNLLRPNIFPRSESKFNELFVNQSTGEINAAYKNMFQRRILGLVSYYVGATPDVFATQTTHQIDVKMSDYQASIYKYFEGVEAKAMQATKGKSESYRTYTRQACNYVFPNGISQDISGEMRPRPSKFRISERDAEKLLEGKLNINESKIKQGKQNDHVTDIDGYMTALNLYMKGVEEYYDEINENDIKNKHTILDDVKTFTEKYKSDYDSFLEKEKKSSLFDILYKSSAKLLRMIFNMFTTKGLIMIYSNYVIMEGVQIIKVYLKYFGYSKYGEEKKTKYTYAEFSGAVDRDERYRNIDIFNKKENKYGDIIKLFFITPAGAEGLSLRNVRQCHIFEPYWHETRILQMIGRGIRMYSHCDLPKDERHVDIYRYKSIYPNYETADQYVERKAKEHHKLVTSFLDALKETAIDCKLNYAHNSVNQDIKCFQFDEPSLFGKQIGPAYKRDILDDVLMNNGSNNPKSVTIKIKVTKIKAVKKMGDNKYSKAENYWYYSETGTVYDNNLHYAMGKIGKDSDGNPIKLDENVYVIDRVIPIPMIRK